MSLWSDFARKVVKVLVRKGRMVGVACMRSILLSLKAALSGGGGRGGCGHCAGGGGGEPQVHPPLLDRGPRRQSRCPRDSVVTRSEPLHCARQGWRGARSE